jgi:hypothetical protein
MFWCHQRLCLAANPEWPERGQYRKTRLACVTIRNLAWERIISCRVEVLYGRTDDGGRKSAERPMIAAAQPNNSVAELVP